MLICTVENIFEVFIICLTVLCQIFIQFYSGMRSSVIPQSALYLFLNLVKHLKVLSVEMDLAESGVFCTGKGEEIFTKIRPFSIL